MADGTVSVSMAFDKGGSRVSSGSIAASVTMTGTDMATNTTLFPVSGGAAVVIPLGSVVAGGPTVIKNNESAAAAILNLGTAAGGGFAASIFAQVYPGEAHVQRTYTGVTIYGKSNDAALTVSGVTYTVDP